jgi:nucleoside-diphosphate-sugar epimerase
MYTQELRKFIYTSSGSRYFYLMERMKALALWAMLPPMDGAEDGSRPTGCPLKANLAGDLAAFELLTRQHERPVRVMALRLFGVQEDPAWTWQFPTRPAPDYDGTEWASMKACWVRLSGAC